MIVVEQGRTIVEFDAVSQEFRWMTILSGDPTMMKLCQPGEDAHSYMGSRIANLDYSTLMCDVKAGDQKAKDTRQMGKFANLSCQYRVGQKKLRTIARVQYDLPMTQPEADLIWITYQRTYPGVPRYWDRRVAETKRLGYAETLSGRRVKVEGDWSKDAWRMGSTGINYPVQGTGADQKYLAIAAMKPLMVEMKARFFLDMHDGLYYDVPDENVEAFVHRGKKILDNLPYRAAWNFDPPIPLPFDVKYGKTWGSLKEWKFD